MRPARLPQSAGYETLCHIEIHIVRRQRRDSVQGQPGTLPPGPHYMPKIIKRIRNLGYRVPFLRRRFELEDILLVGVAVGGSFAVVLGWILWVHWRIL